MKKAIILWIGLIFLLIDTRIAGFLSYPEYIPFDTPAPETVDMIIGHVVGDSAHFDLFSDAVGLGLIVFVTYGIVNENRRAFKAFALAVLSFLLYGASWGMPFVANGETRYVAGFFLFIAYHFLECVTTIQTGLVCCEMAENTENHAWNNVVEIFVILAAASGFIRGMSYFYDLPKTFWLYYLVQVFFTAVYSAMYWKHRNYITQQKTGGTADS